MNVRGTVIMVLIAVALSVVAIAVRGGSLSGADVADTERRVPGAADLPVDDIERIVVTRDEERLVFERDGDVWMQTEPFAYRMDPFSIRQMALQATALQSSQRIDPASFPDGLDATTLGLAPPRAIVEFTWSGGSTTLELGRRGIGGRAYVRVGGDDAIYVVGQELHERCVEMDAREWRDRQIFHAAGIESARIVQVNGELEIVMERERRRWFIRQPVPTRLDEQIGTELFDALGRARSAGFVLDQPSDLVRFGLDAPAGILTVETPRVGSDDVVVERLMVGARCGVGTEDRYGMVEGRPTVLRVPGAVLQAIFRPLEQLCDPVVSGVSAADVKGIRIAANDGELFIERDLERWIAPDERGREVPFDMVDELLQQLTTLRAPQVSVPGEYPRDTEVAIITLHGFTGAAIDTIRVLKDDATGAWALENGDGVLRVLPASMRFNLTATDYGLPDDG